VYSVFPPFFSLAGYSASFFPRGPVQRDGQVPDVERAEGRAFWWEARRVSPKHGRQRKTGEAFLNISPLKKELDTLPFWPGP